jgi:DNA-binding transcriptional LysR family regulator
MNIDTMRIFCDVVLHQSFSRGALVNDVSQSAATQSIHRLERHLGVQLVDRSRRPFILTPEGQICYNGFRSILESYDTVIAMVQTLNDKERGNIRIGATYSVGLYDMGQVMRNFIKSCPKAKVNLELMHSDRIYQSILTSDIDFGVVSWPTTSGSEITVVPLGAEKMVYVCRPDHALAKQKSVSLEQLHGYDFIAFARDQVVRKEIDRHLRQRLTSVNIVAEYENIETIKQAVEVGLGGALLPANSVRIEVKLGKLISIPISSPEIVQPFGIVHKQGKVFTPAMTEFISHLTECQWNGNGDT